MSAEAVRRHYGQWAESYGKPEDDGLFSFVRAREVRMVNELLALRGGESILDAGCGPGIYAAALHARGHEVWACDFAPEMVAQVEGKVDRALVADVTTLDLGRTFDRILCLGVLEWVDARAVLPRLRRHLAEGGRLVALAPRTGPGGWFYARAKRKHGLSARLHSPSEMRVIAAQSGLRCTAVHTPFVHNFVAVFEPRMQTP